MAYPHPIKAYLAMRRIMLKDLSPQVHLNPATLGRVVNGYVEPWPALRARCSEVLGLPEEQLFRVDSSELVGGNRA